MKLARQTINDFKSTMTRGFAKPNLFEVVINPCESLSSKLRNKNLLRFNCHSVQIPGLTLTTTDKDMGFRSIAYHKIYDDITMSFYCSEGMEELSDFYRWTHYIAKPKSTHVEYVDNYISTVLIKQLRADGSNVHNGQTAITTLYEAYPKKIDAISLSYATVGQVMSINITMTYRYYEQTFLPEQADYDDIIKAPQPSET